MATLQDFMARVVPWPTPGTPGVINLHWTRPKEQGWGGTPVTRIEDFLSGVTRAKNSAGRVKDIYFCLSLQSATGAVDHGRAKVVRSQANALALKAIWLDVDVKAPPKGYATLGEAVDAVGKFCAASGYPPPSALVGSGGGLHVYWISDTPLTPEEWKPHAVGLREAAKAHGLLCDAGVTTDAARVLRVPSTFNHKTIPPREVKLLSLAPTNYDFKVLPVYTGAASTAVTAKVTKFTIDETKFPKQPIPPGGIETLGGYDNVPLDPQPVFVKSGCPFFRDALATGGKDHAQGLWNLVILAATFWQNGETLAHELGKKHPTYSPQTTQAMWDRKVRERAMSGLGWPSCAAFENEGSKQCAGCIHKGKIKSPLSLKQVATAATLFATTPAPDTFHPPGYVDDPRTGFPCLVREKPLSNGLFTQQLIPLFLCKLSNAWAGANPDALNFIASMGKGSSRKVVIKQKDMASPASITSSIVSQGVLIAYDNREHIGAYFMHLLQKLQNAKAALSAPAFGWYHDDKGDLHGFAYVGTLYKDDGTESPSGAVNAKHRKLYTPIGKIEPWFEALDLITSQNRPELEAIVAVAFAAPLMLFTGQYNGLLSAHGQTGGNKSTAVEIGLAVWGDPKLTKRTPDTSAKALLKHMGEIGNLPGYWDDVQEEQTDRVGSVLMSLTQGVEGDKLNMSRDFADTGEWQSLLAVCSNNSMGEHFLKKNKSNSAKLHRMLEFGVQVRPKNPLKSAQATRIVGNLKQNFGNMGVKYARLLASDPKGIDKFVTDVINDFAVKVNESGPERFWGAIASTIIAGARLANLLGATFHVADIEKFLIGVVLDMRAKVNNAQVTGGSAPHTSGALTEFIKAMGLNIIWTETMPIGRGIRGPVVLIHGSDPKLQKPIHMRCVVGERIIRVSRKEFYKFLDHNGYSTTAVAEGLVKHYGVTTTTDVNLSNGTGRAGGPETVLVFPVPPGSPLEDTLFAHTPPDQRPK